MTTFLHAGSPVLKIKGSLYRSDGVIPYIAEFTEKDVREMAGLVLQKIPFDEKYHKLVVDKQQVHTYLQDGVRLNIKDSVEKRCCI